MAKTKILGQMGIIQLAGLFLLLVVFPLGSWYYLRTGLDYRLQAMEELQDYGKIPPFTFVNYNDSLLTADRFENHLVIGHFISEPVHPAYSRVLSKLHNQFDERDDVFFLSFRPDTSASARVQLRSFAERHQLLDESQCFFLQGRSGEIENMASAFKTPFAQFEMSLEDNSLLFFADSMMVRGFYDLRSEEDIKKLVKHITLNIPPQKEKDIIFEREVEK